MTQKKILVVGDSRVARRTLRRVLDREYEILEAGDGASALDILRSSGGISAVLMDIAMPGGGEFAIFLSDVP